VRPEFLGCPQILTGTADDLIERCRAAYDLSEFNDGCPP